jgi:hypothetical protein
MPTLETMAIRRAVLEREIERLVDLRDAVDADPDLEDKGDAEPPNWRPASAGMVATPVAISRSNARMKAPNVTRLLMVAASMSWRFA